MLLGQGIQHWTKLFVNTNQRDSRLWPQWKEGVSSTTLASFRKGFNGQEIFFPLMIILLIHKEKTFSLYEDLLMMILNDGK